MSSLRYANRLRQKKKSIKVIVVTAKQIGFRLYRLGDKGHIYLLKYLRVIHI